ncbi:MAG: FAD-binding oxidoreductase [Synechococcales bacterium]|nr:FAD-binding oxidoreductase [Synechococcales bacterium]
MMYQFLDPSPPLPLSPSPMSLTETLLATLPSTLEGLQNADERWRSLRQDPQTPATVVTESPNLLPTVEWDLVICGGTLGILLATALVQRGYRILVLEQGILRGREQEWNISRQELDNLVALGLLTTTELEQAIASEFNPVGIRFNQQEIWVRDVLNVGVDPVYLLETLKQKFLRAGGQLLEQVRFKQAIVHPNGVEVQGEARSHPDSVPPSITTRLLLDGMGHFSPITQQARAGQKPDAVCLVVGTCATGFPKNDSADLIASFTPIQNQCQYFWEAFPARDGRTTYLFTYIDAEPDRPSLQSLFDEYFRLLPTYQQVNLDSLEFKRALFGFFPCYRQSPLQSPWAHILAIGDSSGAQSPLSFGGFGSMIRHLERLTVGIDQALSLNQLDRPALAVLQPYQPNLQVTWLFQKTMSVAMDQSLPANQINQLLADIFQEMQKLGDPVLKPFLQDVVQFGSLSQTLTHAAIAHPLLILNILPQVGWLALLDWMVHYSALGGFALLHRLAPHLQPWIKQRSVTQQYFWQRRVDAWKYGSGNDYHG